MGLRLHRAPWNAPTELPRAVDGAVSQGVGAFLTFGDGATFYHRHHIFALAAERKIPALYDFSLPPAGFDLGSCPTPWTSARCSDASRSRWTRSFEARSRERSPSPGRSSSDC